MEIFAVRLCRRRQIPADKVVLIADLPREGRPHFDKTRSNRRRWRRQVVLDQRVQAGQGVERNHRKHVMLDMVVHVPIDEPRHRIHQHRARIQPMIGDVVGQPAMLQQPGHHMVPRSVKPWQAYHHQGQDRTGPERQADRGGVDCHPDPRDRYHFVGFRRRDIGRLVGVQPAGRIQQHPGPTDVTIEESKEISDDPQEISGAHHRNLGIAAHDIGIGMVARMAPPPRHRIAHDHEAGDLIDDIVHPRRLEGGAVLAFVPAGIRRRSVKGAVCQPERCRPKRGPKPDAEPREQDHRAVKQNRVADRRRVGSLHQLFHHFAGHIRVIPFGCRKPGFHRAPGIRAQKAVVARCHDWLLSERCKDHPIS